MNVKVGILIFTLLFALVAVGCQNAQTSTPTEAYKSLYAAVKSKNTEAIKQTMSKTTQEFAEGMAQMQKKTPDEMYKNGFFESTMSPSLPPMRDERVKGNFGAIEVQRQDGNWGDVPFIKEKGEWKLAVGDVFQNKYESPGKPASQANADTQMPQMMPMPKNTNTMGNVKIVPVNSNAVNANTNIAVKPGMTNKLGKQ